MKPIPFTRHLIALTLGLLVMQTARAQTATGTTPGQTGITQPSEAQIEANQANYAAWDAPEQPIGPNHRTTFRDTKTGRHTIEEIGTGMNYWDGSQWSPSVPGFVAVNGGFAARQVQHQVQLANNLAVDGAVTVQTPDGIVLKSTPVAIALYDSASGNFQVISAVTNCAPTQISSNEVMYIDAFHGGVCASVVYTINAGTFHQDVFITGHLDPADYGFPTNTTLVQILTEFYDAPMPDVVRRPVFVEQNPKVRAAMVAPDLVDEMLGFGQFVMTIGKAYVAPNAVNDKGNEARVVKEYKTIGGRTYLIESVPYVALASDLSALPSCGEGGSTGFNSTGVHGYAAIPKPSGHLAKTAELKVASNYKPSGVVVDYVASIGGTLTGTTVFKGDTTYLVSSAVTCNGAAIIEGNVVFKYKAGTTITLNSTLTCKTGMYRPAVFTGVDDDSVGDTMNGVSGSGYTGTISGSGYANPALKTTLATTFSGLRFRYAQEAIKMTDSSSTTWTVQHSQFINCIKGIELVASSSGCGCGCGCGCGAITSYFNLYNCLMSAVQYPMNNSATYSCGPSIYQNLTLVNSTFDTGTQFDVNSGYYLTSYVRATNSVFVNQSAWVNSPLNSGSSIAFSGGYNGFYGDTTFGSSSTTSGSSPFQTAGAGLHYLAAGSGFRDYGTSTLPSSLITDLRLRTTYPPTNITQNTTITTSQSLTPQAQRDADTLDLGYHYDPIDYAYGNVYVTNATFTMSNGVAVATFMTNTISGSGLGFGSGSTLYSVGLPNNQNWFVLYNTVMEGVGTNGNWKPPTNSVTGELYGRTPSPSIHTRFTSWSVFAQDLPSFYAPTNTGPISFQDCEFHDGKIISYRPTINLTNCLLERVYTSLTSKDSNSPYIRNCEFFGGTLNFLPNVTNSFVKDNLFDQTTIPDNSGSYTTYNGGYNAFVTNYDRLKPTMTGDKILTSSPSYQTGPLGFYYQPTNSTLINAGHTTADQVGLYDYTVSTNLVSGLEIKETNSVVDIGYHYVAGDTNGNPMATYWLGIPDYLSDANGDGALPAWLMKYFGHLGIDPNGDYDGDGTNNLQRFLNGADPNIISFSFSVTNQYVTTNIVNAVVTILGGVPSSYSVLVDSSNFPSATWTAYASSNVTVNISTNQGSHDVWIGLRGLPTDAHQTWEETTLVLDSIAPMISITNPVNNASFNSSRVNIRGYFRSASIKQVTVNDVPAFVSGTNFEALNVSLSAGTNLITAAVENYAGVTNMASINIITTTNADGSLNNPVTLSASPVAGFVPLPVTFSMHANVPGTLQRVDYDFNGDDLVDFTTNTTGSITYSYATNGEYFPLVTLQTSVGRFSSVGGWNAVALDDTNLPIRINVQSNVTMTTFASITDPVDLKWVAPTNLYVLSRSTHTLTEFSTNGSSVRSVNTLGANPTGFDVDAAGNIYVAVSGSNQVWKLNPSGGSYVKDTSFGVGGLIGNANCTTGTGSGAFNAPFDVSVSPDGGSISVSDSGNHRIQQFSAANGNFIDTFGAYGSDVGQFNTPKGLTYDSVGTLYVVDSGNNRIVVAESSTVLGVTGSGGTALGQFSAPVNLSVGERGVFVADTGNNRIQKFDGSDQGLFTITPSSIRYAFSTNFSLPYSVAAVNDLTNDLFYVADTGNNRVVLCRAPNSDANDIMSVWNRMISDVNAKDFNGASTCFSVVSADDYYQDFLTVGTANTISAINQIGTLTSISIHDDTAGYYFDQVIGGQTLTFRVMFVMENGQWKIYEF